MKYFTKTELILRLTSKILFTFLSISHYTCVLWACSLSEANVIVLSMHVCMPPLIRFEPSVHFQIHLTQDTKMLSFYNFCEKRLLWKGRLRSICLVWKVFVVFFLVVVAMHSGWWPGEFFGQTNINYHFGAGLGRAWQGGTKSVAEASRGVGSMWVWEHVLTDIWRVSR